MELAEARATILYGSYRRDDAANPEVFFEAVVAVLSDYPPDCIIYVTDPRSGIQSKEKFVSFPPNPGEVRLECERYMDPIRARREREASMRRQGERRLMIEHHEKKMTAEEIEAKLGRKFNVRRG
jgi:hypothetical protein